MTFISELARGLFLFVTKNANANDIEDFTRIVILYEIYEMSFRRVSIISYEMTTSVRLCLSYDRLLDLWDFIAF